MRSAMLICGACVLLAATSRPASAQADKMVERAVRASSLVVEVQTTRFLRPSSYAEVKIISDLMGASTADKISVNLERAPAGLWPELDKRCILCLAEGSSGKYQLASYSGAVLPTDDDIKNIVSRTSAEMFARPSTPTETAVTPGETAEPAKPQSLLETRASMSETVLVGMLSNITDVPGGRVGTFAVEKALSGYGSYPQPVTVQFPMSVKDLTAGRYALFLRARPVDGGFMVVSGAWGVMRLDDDQEAKKLASEFEAFGADTEKLSSIQATIVEWQAAWNAHELERCMKCYSPASKLREQFDRSADARAKLAEQLKNFPGEIQLSIQKIEKSRTDVQGAAGGADVTVLLAIVMPDGKEDRRPAVMKFVNQDGEWLILEEGF